ncbi:hypothetical protein [Nostoc sp. C117]|uniref:hypothetical protein n=1 Tax=Nostoc sp. C117 TaxID=3349875 RepID=UPI00370D0A02
MQNFFFPSADEQAKISWDSSIAIFVIALAELCDRKTLNSFNGDKYFFLSSSDSFIQGKEALLFSP